MPNLCIQQNPREYPDFVTFLEEIGVQRVVLGVSRGRFNRKLSLIWQTMLASARLRKVRSMGVVVAVGPFAYVVKMLARLGIIRYEKLFCFAFFVHAPAWFRVFRLPSRMDRPEDHYIIFSQSEIELYAERLWIGPGRMDYLPYGDWSREWEPAWMRRQVVKPPL
jgi:hypothetical protein